MSLVACDGVKLDQTLDTYSVITWYRCFSRLMPSRRASHYQSMTLQDCDCVSVSHAQLGLFVSVNFPRKCYCSEIADFGPVLIFYHHASQILNVSSLDPVGSVVYYGVHPLLWDFLSPRVSVAAESAVWGQSASGVHHYAADGRLGLLLIWRITTRPQCILHT